MHHHRPLSLLSSSFAIIVTVRRLSSARQILLTTALLFVVSIKSHISALFKDVLRAKALARDTVVTTSSPSICGESMAIWIYKEQIES
jgi:type II secretory pathway component PulL